MAARTGLKASQFIEEAVQLHHPVGSDERCGRLVRDGEYWMMPAKNRPPLGLDQINEAIEATRLRGDIDD